MRRSDPLINHMLSRSAIFTSSCVSYGKKCFNYEKSIVIVLLEPLSPAVMYCIKYVYKEPKPKAVDLIIGDFGLLPHCDLIIASV